MNSEDDKRFKDLLDYYLNGELEKFNQAEFENYLKFRKYRKRYMEVVYQESILNQVFRKSDTEIEFPARTSLLSKALMVASIILIPILYVTFEHFKNRSTEKSYKDFLVSEVVNCQWLIYPNQEIGEKVVELKKGVAKIVFSDSSEAVLEAPVSFIQSGDNKITLLNGSIFVYGRPGFTVLTKNGDILDLSTNFGVSVDDSTVVQVYKGNVSFDHSMNKKLTLSQRNAINATATKVNKTLYKKSLFLHYLPTKPAGAVLPVNVNFPDAVPYNIPEYDYIDIKEKSIKVDGELEEWDLQNFYTSSCRPPFHKSHTAKWKMSYNSSTLNIAAKVKGPNPLNNKTSVSDHSKSWMAGGLQLLIADKLHTNKRSLNIWYSALQKVSQMSISKNDGTETLLRKSQFKGVHKLVSDNEYQVEYSIPWEVLGVNIITKGDVLPCNLTIHWGDSSGMLWYGYLNELAGSDSKDLDLNSSDTWGSILLK